MKRKVAAFALTAIFAASVVPTSQAEVCVSPRVKRAKSCGVVIDPYGMFVPNAEIVFGAPSSSSKVLTDNHGKFSLAVSGDEVHLHVGAPGFQSVETIIGRLKPASGVCRKPLFVMLTIGEQGCAMISSRKSDLLLAKKE